MERRIAQGREGRRGKGRGGDGKGREICLLLIYPSGYATGAEQGRGSVVKCRGLGLGDQN